MKESKNNDLDNLVEELIITSSSILRQHLEFLSELNQTNPRLATILLIDFSFHIQMLKNLSTLKKEDD